jgi:hypothetical protein
MSKRLKDCEEGIEADMIQNGGDGEEADVHCEKQEEERNRNYIQERINVGREDMEGEVEE